VVPLILRSVDICDCHGSFTWLGVLSPVATNLLGFRQVGCSMELPSTYSLSCKAPQYRTQMWLSQFRDLLPKVHCGLSTWWETLPHCKGFSYWELWCGPGMGLGGANAAGLRAKLLQIDKVSSLYGRRCLLQLRKFSLNFPVTSGHKLPGCLSWSFPEVRVWSVLFVFNVEIPLHLANDGFLGGLTWALHRPCFSSVTWGYLSYLILFCDDDKNSHTKCGSFFHGMSWF
jgi:hypothetical protein